MSEYNECNASTENSKSLILSQQASLENQLVELLEIAKQLSKKIEPIMISSSPTPTKEEVTKMPNESKLCMDLISYTSKIIDIQKVLRDCLSRVQL